MIPIKKLIVFFGFISFTSVIFFTASQPAYGYDQNIQHCWCKVEDNDRKILYISNLFYYDIHVIGKEKPSKVCQDTVNEIITNNSIAGEKKQTKFGTILLSPTISMPTPKNINLRGIKLMYEKDKKRHLNNGYKIVNFEIYVPGEIRKTW